jgi:5'-nucleotidase/UDP-sugar diphosphatase
LSSTIATIDLNGTAVLTCLNAVAQMPVGSGAFTQFAGLQLVITDGVVSRVRVRGETLEAGRSDRLVRIKFQATCGDGYRNLIPHTSFVDTGFIDADVLRTFIADQGG